MKTLVLLGLLVAPLPAAAGGAEVPGYGPWHLGMSREQVAAVSEFGPYEPVASTGGLETRHAELEGKTITASFVFGSSGLFHIQLWAYEGQDYSSALEALHGVYGYLSDQYGPLATDEGRIPAGLSKEGLDALVPDAFKKSDPQLDQLTTGKKLQVEMLKFHLYPQSGPENLRVYASLMHSPQLGFYYVFLYFKTPSGS